MANIQPEITAFQTAVYGEDVRSSMISLANKLNDEVEDDTQNVTDYTASITTQMGTLSQMQSDLSTKQTEVRTLIAQAEADVTSARTSATNAKSSETKAKTSETNAKDSEDKAKHYADEAKQASYQQSDWNENNSMKSAFINNKPFQTLDSDSFVVDADRVLKISVISNDDIDLLFEEEETE